MKSVFPVAIALVLIAPKAEAQPAPGPTIGLSDAEKAEILSRNTEASVEAARAGAPVSTLSGTGGSRGVHGEIGAGIGTNGYRSVYGAAAIPLGENGGATVMFEQDRWGRR